MLPKPTDFDLVFSAHLLFLYPLGQQSFQSKNCLYVKTLLNFTIIESGWNGWILSFFLISCSCPPILWCFVAPTNRLVAAASSNANYVCLFVMLFSMLYYWLVLMLILLFISLRFCRISGHVSRRLLNDFLHLENKTTLNNKPKAVLPKNQQSNPFINMLLTPNDLRVLTPFGINKKLNKELPAVLQVVEVMEEWLPAREILTLMSPDGSTTFFPCWHPSHFFIDCLQKQNYPPWWKSICQRGRAYKYKASVFFTACLWWNSFCAGNYLLL